MLNAGMVVGYIVAGDVVVRDSYGITRYSHVADTELGGKDNIKEFGGRETDDSTIIEFKMPVYSGDRDDVPLTAGVHNVIWAYGATDDLKKHTAAGYVMIDMTPD